MCLIRARIGLGLRNLGKTRAGRRRFWAGMLGVSGILAKNL